MKKRIVIGVVGPKNTPIGEAHHRAVLTDEEVEMVRAINEEGFLGPTAIGKAFGVSRGYIYNLINYRTRACTPDRYKTVEVTIKEGKLTEFREIE